MKLRVTFSMVLALALLLGSVGLAYAVYFSIDTNDGSVDTGTWNAHTPNHVVTGHSGGPAGAAITDAWVALNGSGGTPNEIAFRLDFDGAFDPTPDGYFAVAQIDCNHNSSFADAVDLWIAADPRGSDYLYIAHGNDGSWSSDFTTTNLGEWIDAANDTVEWKVTEAYVDDPTLLGSGTWGACVTAAGTTGWGIRFGTSTSVSPSLDLDQVDAAQKIDTPTAVGLNRLAARSANTPFILALGSLGLLAAGMLVMRRARRR